FVHSDRMQTVRPSRDRGVTVPKAPQAIRTHPNRGTSETPDLQVRSRFSALGKEQGRQDSNLQPPVLETGALPIAPRPWVARRIVSAASGHICAVSTIEEDRPDDDDLLEEQEGQGYGEDEGEREDALDAQADE